MMKFRAIVLLLPLCFLLAGCWSNFELKERGVVMGASLDLGKDGQIEMTAQIYKPSPSVTEKGEGGKKYINIQTKGTTVLAAIQDITSLLGRKAQWSHMQSIIIGERLAQEKNIFKILEYFYRDYETRLTSSIMISEGNARDFLDMQPLIENNGSKQYRNAQKKFARDSAKTIDVNLYELRLKAKSETGTAVIPYIRHHMTKRKSSVVSGVAIIKNDKMVSIVSPREVVNLNILNNKFQHGIFAIPCSDKKDETDLESFEVSKIETENSLKVDEQRITYYFLIKIKGKISELVCTNLDTTEAEIKYTDKIEQILSDNLQATVTKLQQQGIDLIDAGNRLYRKDPVLWKQWKANWSDHFKEVQTQIKVDVQISNTGMIQG